MTLSDDEQRRLDDIEHQLWVEDPRFTRRLDTLHGEHVSGVPGEIDVRGLLIVFTALVIVFVGIMVDFLPVGVLGFVAMIVGGNVALQPSTHHTSEAARVHT